MAIFDESTNSNLSFSSAGSLLLFEQNYELRSALAQALTEQNYSVKEASSQQEVSNLLDNQNFDIFVYELCNDEVDGISWVRNLSPRSIIIAITNNDDISLALEAVRLGATDCLVKPIRPEDLVFALRKAQQRDRLKLSSDIIQTQTARRYSFNNIVSSCPQMTEIFDVIKKIADYKTTILLQGESGTGKELIARAVHHNSVRRNKRFIAINCGAIPEHLLESELFGHKKGAFTDALKDKKGLFEEAEGGTILLDEVGELPGHLQVKLLRVLQESELRPVGDTRVIPINVRVIAATLRDLESDVLDSRFRDDLFYRLNVVTLRIPPLRERKEDIPLLVNHFIKQKQEKLGLAVYGISKEAIAALLEHDWPGNIRELENCIERAMILTEGNEITLKSLPKAVRGEISSAQISGFSIPANTFSIKEASRTIEQTLIQRALLETNGNRTHAAKLLEISHRTLLYKLKEYNLATDETSDSA